MGIWNHGAWRPGVTAVHACILGMICIQFIIEPAYRPAWHVEEIDRDRGYGRLSIYVVPFVLCYPCS